MWITICKKRLGGGYTYEYMKKYIKYVSLAIIIIVAVLGVAGGKAEAQTPVPVAPTITVLSPNGGESWQQNSNQIIYWSSVNIPSSNFMKIVARYWNSGEIPDNPLDTDGVIYTDYVLAETVPNTGSAKVSTIGLPTGPYSLQVKTPGTEDWTNSYFKIFPSIPTFCFTFTRDLRLGSEGPDVAALQKFLISKGFDIPNITRGQTPYGYFGGATKVALQNYQRSVGIEATGFFGPVTRAMVNASCVNNQQPPAINSVTNPISPGQQMSIFGSNLNGTNDFGKVYIDTVLTTALVDGGREGTFLFFTLPNNISLGTHSLYVTTDSNRTSNVVGFQVQSSSEPRITILSPNGGEVYKVGSVVNIKWNTNIPGSQTVNLWLSDKYGNTERVIASPIQNTGNYSWTIPQDLVPDGTSGAFKIFINTHNTVGGVFSDYSDAPFTVISSSNISEQVKCVFSGVTTEQRCYTAVEAGSPLNFGCSGIVSCVVNVNGPKGTQLDWKSTCGNHAYTTIDGQTESANFYCKATPVPYVTSSITPDTQVTAVYNSLYSNKDLSVGVAVKTTDNLNVRLNAGGEIIGTQPSGSVGVIAEGSVEANGNKWYKINYYSGISGWSVSNYLNKISN